MPWLDSLLQLLSSLSVLELSSGLAAVAFLVLVISALRSGKAPTLPSLKDSSDKDSPILIKMFSWIIGLVKTLISDLRTLAGRNEESYKVPWVLMMGSGTTSIGYSLSDSSILRYLSDSPVEDPESIGLWNFNRGVLVDFESLARKSSEEDAISGLSRLRSERPIDSILLCLSASEILESSSRELMDMGIALSDRLNSLQEKLGFTFPVYVLITKSDLIPGFSEFAQTRTTDELSQIFGWSNPSPLEANYDANWIAEALTRTHNALVHIQLDGIAGGSDYSEIDVDSYVLFAPKLQKMESSIDKVLRKIFSVTIDKPNFYFRGIYFSGIATNSGLVGDTAIDKVVFIDELFAERIFAEKHLARSVDVTVFSRQNTIRRIQKSLAVLVAGLAIGLGYSTLTLRSQIENIESILDTIYLEHGNNAANSSTCSPFSTIEALLLDVSSLEYDLGTPFMPWSYFDDSYRTAVAQVASQRTFQDVIFPAFRCKMNSMASALEDPSIPEVDPSNIVGSVPEQVEAVNEYLNSVIALHEVESVWDQFANTNQEDGISRLQDIDSLLRLLYQNPMPRQVSANSSNMTTILQHVDIEAFRAEEPAVYSNIRAQITDLITSLDNLMNRGLDVGSELLPSLSTGTADVAEVRRFVTWLDWIDNEWLTNPGQTAACEQISETLRDELEKIDQYPEYDGLAETLNRSFEKTYCRNLAQSKLAPLRLEPLANLITPVKETTQENPSADSIQEYTLAEPWRKERDYLEALTQLDFMQLETGGAFSCIAGATQWNSGSIAEASKHTNDFIHYLRSINGTSILASTTATEPEDSEGNDSEPSDDTGSTGNGSSDSGADDTSTPSSDAEPNSETTSDEQNPSPISIDQAPHIVIGQTKLAQTVNSLLSDAQRQLRIQNDYSSAGGLNAQNTLRAISNNFARSASDLESLFGGYEALQMQNDGQAIAACIQQFSSRQLGAVNNLAAASKLMLPNTSTTEYFKNGTPLFQFGSGPVAENWWPSELSRAELVLDYAKPFVSFINLTKTSYGSLGQPRETAQYWGNSLVQLQNKVEFGRTDGQVDELEKTFIAVTDVSDTNCSSVISSLPSAPLGIDFFSERRHSIKKTLVSNCSSALSESGSGIYTQLSSAFANIAGRFPFASVSTGNVAKLSDIRSFFLTYASGASELDDYLRARTAGNHDQHEVLEAMDKLADASRFFNSHLSVEGPPKRLNLDVTFRVPNPSSPNTGGIPGNENVMIWSMSNGIESVFRPERPNASLSWYYGEDLTVSFTWPPSVRPVVDATQSHMQLNRQSNQVSFVFDGDYALQQLIAIHAQSGPAPGDTAPKPIVLRFEVPVEYTESGNSNSSEGSNNTPSQTVQLFVELDTSTVDDSGQPVPVFVPTTMPFNFPSDN